MSRINEKLGLKPAGARARMQALSGVACPQCPHHDVRSYVISAPTKPLALRWRCAACSYAWLPTAAEVLAYNLRVRERDRIQVPA